MPTLEDLQKLLKQTAKEIPKITLRVIGVEALAFIDKNFTDGGFNNNGLEQWKARKTTDKKGKDLTHYRTNKRGKQGSLTKFGQREQGRGILIGHASKGVKLKNSFKKIVNETEKSVTLYTAKEYAAKHNEGLNGMPKRPFLNHSTYLENKIHNKLKKEFDKITKP